METDLERTCAHIGHAIGLLVGAQLSRLLDERSDDWCSVKEASEKLNLNPESLRRKCRRGDFGDRAKRTEAGIWLVRIDQEKGSNDG